MTTLNPNPKCETCIYYISTFEKHCEIIEQLRCALKITQLGIWEWDLVKDKIYISDEVFEITGADPTQFDGSLAYIADHILYDVQRDFFLTAVQNDIANGAIQIREYRINHPTKEQCWVRLNGDILYDEDKKPYKLIGTLLDITHDYLSNNALKTNLEFLESIIEALPNPIFYKDAHGLYRFCNSAFSQYLGLTQEQIINKSVYDVSPKALADVYKKADMDLLHSKGSQVYEANVRYADGSLHDVIFSKAVHLDDNNTAIGIVGIMQDITDKKSVERQVTMLHTIKDVFLEINHLIMTFNTEQELLQALITKLQVIFPACTQSSVLELGADDVLTIVASNGFKCIERDEFKLPLKESFMWIDVNGSFSDAHIVNDVVSYVASGVTEVLTPESGKTIASTLIVPIEINGALKWFFSIDSDQNNIFTDIDRKVANFIREELPLVFRIFELYQTTLELSRYDALTGFMNRSYFDTIFDYRILEAVRNNETLIVVLFDLDGLKAINDHYGHYAGDLYLKSFSQFIESSHRQSDTFSRIGGDEFIGLYSATNENALFQKILNLRETFKNTNIALPNDSFRGNFSYGIAKYPADALDKNKLMQIADMNMYVDKANNKSLKNTNI